MKKRLWLSAEQIWNFLIEKKGDFEYPEWHSGVKYVMRHSDCDDEFFLPEESLHCFDEYTNAST